MNTTTQKATLTSTFSDACAEIIDKMTVEIKSMSSSAIEELLTKGHNSLTFDLWMCDLKEKFQHTHDVYLDNSEEFEDYFCNDYRRASHGSRSEQLISILEETLEEKLNAFAKEAA